MHFKYCFSYFRLVMFLLILLSSGSTAGLWAADLGLIEAEELLRLQGQNQSSPNLIILDARPFSDWQGGHIPGAMSFSWKNHTGTDAKGIPYRINSPENIAQVLGEMGISIKSHIVVYGDADKSWGGEGWVCWVLAWLGHNGPIRLLNGGIQAWNNGSYPLSKSIKTKSIQPVIYQFKVNNTLNITSKKINQNKKNYQLIDTRTTFEWLMGHQKGTIHISWKKFFKGKNRQPLSSSETKTLLKKNGIDIEKPVVYFCTGGVRSAYAWLVHELAGLPASINFEGGMAEWEKSGS